MTRSTLRRSLVTTATVAAAATLGLASLTAAHASTAPHAAQHAAPAAKAGASFTFVSGGVNIGGKEGKQVGIFHGSINGGGLDVSKGSTDTVHLPDGTLVIKHPNSQAHFVPKVDPATCYATFKITGPFSLAGGTGAYTTARGSGSYVVHGTGYLKRTAGGGCNMKAAPLDEFFSITAKGTLG